MFFDAHNHLQDETLAPHLDAIVADLAALPLGGAVVNGTNEDDWDRVAELAARHPWIIPSYGLHPWDAGNRSPDWFAKLRARLDADPRAAVGEIGLDRWMLAARPDDPRLAGLRRAELPEQGEVMLKQLALAASENRPVTIHCIQAWGTLCEILERVNLPGRGFLLHAYAGPAELIPRFAALGAYFSLNPAFLPPKKSNPLGYSFPKAAVLENFKNIPQDRILVETDAPAMPPPATWQTHALPGGLSHPGNIAAATEGLAAALGLPDDTVTQLVAENFQRLFG
ncbi:MAG: TatD family hydrolase [Verrucomicrobiota bacterium]